MPSTSEASDDDWREAFRSADSLAPTATSGQKQARGRQLERILGGMFAEGGMRPRLSYRPKGEEVDGSIWFHGRTILIEGKWTQEPHPASSLYQFRGKVDGKLAGTLGLFISMSGFSSDAVDALVAGKELNLVLADGDDIRAVVDGTLTVEDALTLKLRAAGDAGVPYVPLRGSVAASASSHTASDLVLVEGAFDVRVLGILRTLFEATRRATIMPAGGPGNMGLMISAVSSLLTSPARLTIVLDEDGLSNGTASRVIEAVADAKEHANIDDAKIVRLAPDLDTAIGLVDPGAQLEDRRRLRRLSDADLTELLRKTDIETLTRGEQSLATVLTAIGVDVSQQPDSPENATRVAPP